MEKKKPMIKPSHRGLLHEALHIAKGKKIPGSKLKSALKTAKKTHNVKEEREIVFAENFGKKKK